MTVADLIANPATPRWAIELHTFLPVKSQFVLYGNIRDRFAFPLADNNYDLRPMHQYSVDFLHAAGFQIFLLIDPVFGITMLTPAAVRGDPNKETREAYRKQTLDWLIALGKTCDPKLDLNFRDLPGAQAPKAALEFAQAVSFLEALVRNTEKRAVVFFDYMMGLAGLERTVDSFIRSLIMSYEARPFSRDFQFFNTVVWFCDRENELPAWFTLNNPRIRSIAVSKPNTATRQMVCAAQLRNSADVEGTPKFSDLPPAEQVTTLNDFVGQTESLTLNDVAAIARFRMMGKLDVRRIADASRRYKLGITEDPWQKMIQSRADLPAFVDRVKKVLEKRVKGQARGVDQALTIVKKALLGLAGAQAGTGSGKPKGVLFLAGPTGTGKTELAKSLTEALFNDEKAYIRFDMSEFNQEHSDQRLIGAPPGYVGFEAGGELTQAIREKPCSVVLFDEIEKAHPKILDKFLQILDDGQLTSGKGERVYFSESIIIFTSNLGMKEINALGRVPDFEELGTRIRAGIGEYFREKLQRPEILNRLGDNIVVFDFIREESARLILEKKVEAVLGRLKEQLDVSVELAKPDWNAPNPVWTRLYSSACGDLSMGGRGIGNRIETVLEKPLVDFFSAALPAKGDRFVLIIDNEQIAPAKAPPTA